MNNLQTPNTAPNVDLIKYVYDGHGTVLNAKVLPLCRDCRHLEERHGHLYCALRSIKTHLNLTCLDGSFLEERGNDK